MEDSDWTNDVALEQDLQNKVICTKKSKKRKKFVAS